ncbi:hypothetical protein DIPPA_54476, partial [Diplonema papillatum]
MRRWWLHALLVLTIPLLADATYCNDDVDCKSPEQCMPRFHYAARAVPADVVSTDAIRQVETSLSRVNIAHDFSGAKVIAVSPDQLTQWIGKGRELLKLDLESGEIEVVVTMGADIQHIAVGRLPDSYEFLLYVVDNDKITVMSNKKGNKASFELNDVLSPGESITAIHVAEGATLDNHHNVFYATGKKVRSRTFDLQANLGDPVEYALPDGTSDLQIRHVALTERCLVIYNADKDKMSEAQCHWSHAVCGLDDRTLRRRNCCGIRGDRLEKRWYGARLRLAGTVEGGGCSGRHKQGHSMSKDLQRVKRLPVPAAAREKL